MQWQSLRRWLFPASPARRLRCRPRLESLEHRLAPATMVNLSTVTFRDVDGDTVTVKLSQNLLTAGNVNNVFTFDTGSVNGSNAAAQQLQKLDLTAALAPAAHTTLGLTVTVKKAANGDGLTNVGFINAAGESLGAVAIAGDLGRINASGIQTLTVQSLGDHFALTSQGGTGSLHSLVVGNVGAFNVKANVDGARLLVVGTLGTVTIGGSLNGDATYLSGNIFSTLGTGMVSIGGNIQGGAGTASGEIATDGTLAGATIGGSITGGGGLVSGQVFSVGNMGVVTVKGSVTGGTGAFSGSITVSTDIVGHHNNPSATLAGVSIGGALSGGGGTSSGQVFANGDITGAVTITGGITGGAGDFSGEVFVNSTAGTFAKGVTIGGSLTGAQGNFSGEVFTKGSILGTVLVKGGLQGGAGTASGAIGAQGQLKSVTVGGSISSGAGTHSGAIQAGLDLGTVMVGGDLTGTAANPVTISAVGPAKPTGLTDVAIASLTIKGNVTFANILAGHNTFSAGLFNAGVNADAQIGTVSVGKNWSASNLIAGIGAGADGVFGTGDDAKLAGSGVTDVGAIVSTISSLTIGGTATPMQGGNFGIEAEYIVAAKIGGTAKALDPTTNDVIVLDPTLTLQELP